MCERFHIRPPMISESWETIELPQQIDLLAYEEIRQEEESKQWLNL